MRRHRATLGLVAWTLFVWTTRITNVWRDADLGPAQRWGATLLASSLLGLALAVVVALGRRAPQATLVVVGALAVWTSGVWIVRGTAILAGNHDPGFKAVHSVLAVVSIVLAGLAWLECRRGARSRLTGPADATAPTGTPAPTGTAEPVAPRG